ncbi:MAG TPA: class I SAM-dependent methyltransferase [Planctomycetaceae bacterium]|jgi:predicted O-methyltransferase YrrM
MNLEDLYHRAWQAPGNINEHLPVLRMLAAESQSIVEIGTDAANSTVAFLAAEPARLTTIDIRPSPAAEALRPFIRDIGTPAKARLYTDFRILQADSLAIEIEACDLLFIDSKHTCEQLSQELRLHANKARRWIVLHDTVTFGMTGEDGGRGLAPALNEFLTLEFGRWRVVAEWRNNNGLTVLKRYKTALDFPPYTEAAQ